MYINKMILTQLLAYTTYSKLITRLVYINFYIYIKFSISITHNTYSQHKFRNCIFSIENAVNNYKRSLQIFGIVTFLNKQIYTNIVFYFFLSI